MLKALRTWPEIAAILALALTRAGWTLSRAPVPSGDTPRYWNPDDPLYTLRFDVGQGPGQLMQLLYLLPLNVASAVQSFLAALLWGWAVFIATRGLPRMWFWIGLAFTLSPWWLLWDNRLVAESMTLAGMSLFAAGVMRWVRGSSAVPMLSGATVALLARPLTVPLVAALLIVAVLSRREWPRPRWAATGLAALNLFAVVQAVAFNRAPVNYHWLPFPLPMQGVRAGDRFVSRSHVDGYLQLAQRHAMPECPAALDVPRGIPGLEPLWTDTCPEMVAWLREGGLPWRAELIENTGPTLAELVSGDWLITAWGNDALQDTGWQLLREFARTWWWPTVTVTNVVMWTVVALSALWLLRPGRHVWFRVLLVVASLGFASALWLFDGLEMWRHVLPAVVVLAPAALASSGMAADSRA